MKRIQIKHGHFFCGSAGGAKGFNMGSARVGNLEAEFVCIGGIDNDPGAIHDFDREAGCKGTVMDLFTRQQYTAFHGHEPPPGWREATPDDIRAAFHFQRPDIGFTSSPCKGLSGLLNETLSKTSKYQALNELTLRGIWLMCETWKDDPVPLILFENVPRIASRGRHLLDQIGALLRHYGYAVAETTHDCGELGGLGQSRKRFLLVARHIEKVPPFLYEPPKRPLRSVGEVLGRIPLPGDPAAGPMHRIPALQWKTWVRLAFVEAGGDWRSLSRLRIEDGKLADYLIVPEYRADYLGVTHWDKSSGTITGRSSPTNGRFAIADPRFTGHHEYSQYGVLPWDKNSGAISGQSAPGGGKFSIADPRAPSGAFQGKYSVTHWDRSTGTVIGANTTGQGAFAVADPRPANIPQKGDNYLTGGHYGVLPWGNPSGAVSAAACHDNGRFSVADPRVDEIAAMPRANDKLVAIIRALDGTWHRPMTTLDMAALQSYYDPDDYAEGGTFNMYGNNDESKRERIGNMVPPAAAKAIADVMGQTLLLAWSGETFALGSTPIWVRPVAIALSVAQGGQNG